MQDTIIRNKVNVFISSNCNKIFFIIRESLKFMLLETGLCEVYVFEETHGTTVPVEQSFMHPLEKCDLVVFLIDNSEPLGEGTLKEVKRAKELKKKCIYLFCDEFEKKPTELQNELKNNLLEKYQVVNKLSHLAEEAFICVLNDIMDIYSLYCAKKLDMVKRPDEGDSLDTEGIIVDNANSPLKRDSFKEYDYTKTILNNDFLFQREVPNKINGLDFLSSELLRVVIGNKDIADIDFAGLKKSILEFHSGRMKSLVDHRLDGVYNYFTGNLQEAEMNIREAIKIAKETKKIPKWILNDVAIDLRYIEYLIGKEKNELLLTTEGQEILDAGEELVYYPILDRFTTKLNKTLIRDIMDMQLDSPFTVTYGGEAKYIDQVIDIFVSALCYGSLTHILLIREKLFECYENSCLQTRNHKMFIFVIKMLLLCGQNKELKKFLQAYGEYTDNISDEDVRVWENAIDNIQIRHLRMVSALTLFEYFGGYFEENHFHLYYEKIKAEMNQWYQSPYASDAIVNGYLNSIEQNQYRISQKEVLNIAYDFFNRNYRRWYDDIFKLLKRIEFDTLENEEIEQCIRWIRKCVEDKEIKQFCHYLPYMIQNVRLQIGERKELDDLVREHFPTFYENTYSLHVLSKERKKRWEHIQKRIESIKVQNATQGAGGVYSGYAINEYVIIANILCYDKVNLTKEQVKSLLEVLLETLTSERQTYSAKTEALNLILLLRMYYPKIHSVEEAITAIIDNKNKYLRSKDLFLEKGYGEGTIQFMYGLLQVLRDDSINNFIGLFSRLSKEDVATNIIVLQRLTRILECGYIKCIPENFQNLLVYYLLDSSMHTDRTIRFYSYVSLIHIHKQCPSYSALILNRLSQAMDGEVYENKVGILSRIEKDSSDITRYIYEKGRADNHYLVRKIANN